MNLSEKIWYTRKSRINASERLERNDFWSQLLLNYYSVLIVVFSIWALYDETADFSLIIVSLSVLLLSISLFVTSRNFKERSLTLKNCYLKLDDFYKQTTVIENEQGDNRENILQIHKEYVEFLKLFENHKRIDYLTTKFDAVDSYTDNLSFSEYAYFFGYNFLKILFLGFLFFLPIIIIKIAGIKLI